MKLIMHKDNERDVIAGFAFAGRHSLAAGRMFNAIRSGMATGNVNLLYIIPTFARNVVFGMFKTYAKVYGNQDVQRHVPGMLSRSTLAGVVAGTVHGSLTASAELIFGKCANPRGLLLSQALSHGVFFPVYELLLDRTQVWLNTNLNKKGGVLCVMIAGSAAGFALGGATHFTRMFEAHGIRAGLHALRYTSIGYPTWSILFAKVPFFGAGMLAFEYAGRLSHKITQT